MFWSYLYFILMAPGIIVHELAHAFFCWLFKVKIYSINLLRFDRVAGYVTHEEPRGFFASFFVSFGPLIINSALAVWLFAKVNWASHDWRILLYLWLAIALGLQAIPSTGDAKALWQSANHKLLRNPLVILFYPLVLLLYILNFLKRLYIDFIFVVFLFYVARTYWPF
ncbi:MAG: metalloprotease family protein [Patescibacteria group bacterium]